MTQEPQINEAAYKLIDERDTHMTLEREVTAALDVLPVRGMLSKALTELYQDEYDAAYHALRSLRDKLGDRLNEINAKLGIIS